MKTFNLIAMVVFTITATVCFVAGFYNPCHFVLSAISVLIIIVAYAEYKQIKKEDKSNGTE